MERKIQQRATQGSARSLTLGKGSSDFVSNDYLGLSRSQSLFERIQGYDYSPYISLNGATGSRLLTGNSAVAQRLESKLARLFSSPSALLFNSGYVANLALLSSIPQRGDTILYDQLSHVCLKEGAALSKAKRFSFRHNDCHDLSRKLKQAQGNIYVVVESVYSMYGDTAPWEDLIALVDRHKAHLIVDEAHSTGIYGEQGAGMLDELGLAQHAFARIHTFGKAMGVYGACICGSETLIKYLINFATPFIYTTALPLHSLFSIDAAFDHLSEHAYLQKELRDKITQFHDLLRPVVKRHPSLQPTISHTPIQPLIVPGNERVKTIASTLQTHGFDIRPILSPTVSAGSERLRITLHTHNTPQDMAKLIQHLSSLL